MPAPAPACTDTVWPWCASSRTPLGHVTSLAFSPRGGYAAVGNDKGRVLLYRLNHWPDA